jgi:hypothetical protein
LEGKWTSAKHEGVEGSISGNASRLSDTYEDVSLDGKTNKVAMDKA